VSRILDLVENAANKKAPTETFITKFARYYTPTVVGFAVLLATVPPLFFGGEWFDWISRALIFLVISCPCALVVSIPLGFFGGIGGASKRGILVKGGNYLEALANLDLVVFDKTGTLTRGVFKVRSLQPANGFDENGLLSLAAHAEAFSNHPIAVSILKEYGGEIDKENLARYEEIAGHGVSVNVKGQTILAGNEKLMRGKGIAFAESQGAGTKVHVAADGVYAGCVVIADETKPDSHGLVASLKKLGVRKTVMLTGDTPQIAEAVAGELGIDEAHASLLPQQKVEKVEALARQKLSGKTLAFVGDGINDAPVLAMADVGVAMGGLGSDAAIEAADVVLMTDEPSKLVEAVKVARFTKRVVWQNIILSLGIKFLFLFLATLGVSSLWEAVFADVGVSLIAVFNSLRVMRK
jgi:Cd2+/Zn2+-exporting ATPase